MTSGSKDKAFSSDHGDDVMFERTIEDTPLALVGAERSLTMSLAHWLTLKTIQAGVSQGVLGLKPVPTPQLPYRNALATESK